MLQRHATYCRCKRNPCAHMSSAGQTMRARLTKQRTRQRNGNKTRQQKLGCAKVTTCDEKRRATNVEWRKRFDTLIFSNGITRPRGWANIVLILKFLCSDSITIISEKQREGICIALTATRARIAHRLAGCGLGRVAISSYLTRSLWGDHSIYFQITRTKLNARNRDIKCLTETFCGK